MGEQFSTRAHAHVHRREAATGTGRRRRAARVAAGLVIALVTAVTFAPAASAAAPTPPTQPASGPGGAGYSWSGTIQRAVTFSDHTKDYWTFEPTGWTGGGTAPTTAPLVAVLHGWLGDNPSYYQQWINHLVRKGNVVVFPRYQTSALTPPANFTGNAIYSLQQALPMLAANATVKPNLALGMTLVAHSWGGPVTVNIASRWSASGLPQPKAVLLVEPFDRNIDTSLAGIPTTTKLVCLVGDVDTTVGRTGCDTIWDRTGHIPVSNRNYAWMFSDAHGSPALTADHRVPTSGTSASTLDALDWYGTWKLGDALRDCGLSGTNCATALGGGPAQTSLGTWSDGVAVRPLAVTTAKPPCPAGSGAKGC